MVIQLHASKDAGVCYKTRTPVPTCYNKLMFIKTPVFVNQTLSEN